VGGGFSHKLCHAINRNTKFHTRSNRDARYGPAVEKDVYDPLCWHTVLVPGGPSTPQLLCTVLCLTHCDSVSFTSPVRNRLAFYVEVFSSPASTSRLKNQHLSALIDCLFKIFAICSAFTDKPERNCHFPAPGRNCMTHRQALHDFPDTSQVSLHKKQ
jgi:hypothetical protein